MADTIRLKRFIYLVAASTLSGGLTLAIAFTIAYQKLPQFDLPFTLGGDGLGEVFHIQRAIENPLQPLFERLSAPFGQNSSDFFPMEAFHDLTKILGYQLTGSVFGAAHFFYALTYFAAAFLGCLSFGSVGRHFGIGLLEAGAGGVLFGLLPYHFMRGPLHLSLSGYHFIPLVFFPLRHFCGRLFPMPWKPGRWDLALSSLACIPLATSGAYYAAYSLGVILLSAFFAAFQKKADNERAREKYWIPLLVFVSIFSVCVLWQRWPTFEYFREWGRNALVGVRRIWDIEIHSHTLFSLMGPHVDHRVAWFHDLRQMYFSRYVDTGEFSWGGPIGVIPSLGLLSLWWGALLKRRPWNLAPLAGVVTRITAVTWLALEVGGLASFLVLIPSLPLRSHSRIGPVFGLIGLFCFLCLIEGGIRRVSKNRLWARVALWGLVLAFGVFEQTRVLRWDTLPRADFEAYQSYFSQMEAAVPKGTLVFSLGNFAFPEHTYTPALPVLFTRSLRFSGLPVRGREPEKVISALEQKIAFNDDDPSPEWLKHLANAGYEAILLDRSEMGLAHWPRALRSLILLDGGPLASDGLPRYVFAKVPKLDRSKW